MILEAQLIDLHLRQIYPVALEVEEQKIKKPKKQMVAAWMFS